jgi:hypothetical protein
MQNFILTMIRFLLSQKLMGLKSNWGNRNFVNPPYGKEVSRWIQKGYEESLKGKIVVFLLPNRRIPAGGTITL